MITSKMPTVLEDDTLELARQLCERHGCTHRQYYDRTGLYRLEHRWDEHSFSDYPLDQWYDHYLRYPDDLNTSRPHQVQDAGRRLFDSLTKVIERDHKLWIALDRAHNKWGEDER